jgi:hypothetical protein
VITEQWQENLTQTSLQKNNGFIFEKPLPCVCGEKTAFHVTLCKENCMKRNIFWLGMLVIILALGMTVVSCDDGGDDNNNNNGNGSTNTPEVYFLSDGVWIYFSVSLTDSTLPGINANNRIEGNSCGFTITSGGNTLTISFIAFTSDYMAIYLPTGSIPSGQQATVSYVPNGTHIFKTSDGKTLGAFTRNRN